MFDISTTYPHLLVLCETWFSEPNINDLQGFQGYHTLRTIEKSGGLTVYIKSCSDSRFLPDLSFVNQDIDVCTVKISVDKLEAFIIGIWRLVTGRFDSFLYNLDENFLKFVPHKQKCFYWVIYTSIYSIRIVILIRN